MGLRVNTNIASLTAQRNLSSVSSRLTGNFSKLSSGLRVANAADDAAGLGISERMRSQIRSLGAAGRNAQDGISLVQTAEGALNEGSNILSRMRELAVQASNGTLSTDDRNTIDSEVQALVSELGRISDSTTFNGVNLLDGSSTTASIQVGINDGETIDVTLQDTSTSTLGVNSLDVTTASNASSSGSFQIPDVEDGKFNVAMVLIGPHDDGGWSQAHYEGLQYIEKNVQGTHTAYVELVPEGAQAEQVYRSLARKGFNLIFGTSFGLRRSLR